MTVATDVVVPQFEALEYDQRYYIQTAKPGSTDGLGSGGRDR